MSEPLTCPVCRATNERGPSCRRCKADLSLLFGLREQRQRVLSAAYHEAARGRWRRAIALAQGVEALRADPEVRQLLAVAHLMQGDYAGAWRWSQAAASLAGVRPATTAG
jgi:hypothetical protein